MTGGRLVWVIGDSWSDPTFDGRGLTGWPWLTAERLGVGLVNGAQAGAGYVNAGNGCNTFPIEVERFTCPTAAVAVLFGSCNDVNQDPVAVQEAAVRTIRRVQLVAPDATVLVIGPQYWNIAPPEQLPVIRDAVASAAAQAGVTFVDALGWMRDRPELIGADAHPNDAGHRWLMEVMVGLIAPLLTPIAPAVAGTGLGWAASLGFPADFTTPDGGS